MDIIDRLKAEQNERRTKIRNILAGAKQGDRAMTPAEIAECDRESAALAACDAKLVEELKALEFDRNHAVPIDRAGGMEPARRIEGVPGAKAKYADLFGPVARAEGGFKDSGEFFEAVASGRFHPGLRAAMNESVGSEGGFLVPTEYSQEYFDESLEDEVVRPRARVYAMQTDARKVAGFQMDGDSTFGPYGFAPVWTAEAAAITPDRALVRSVSLTAWKLACIIQASNELVADGMSYAAQLDRVLRNALSWQLDYEFLQGNGAGRPIGVVNAPCTISVAKVGGQTAATIVSDNVLSMYARLLPSSYRRATWVVHPSCVPQLMKLSIPVGVGGNVSPYFSMDAGRMTLINLPVVTSEKMATLGTKGDIGLFDFSFYAVGLRREITLDRSAHVGFLNDIESFRATLRADGKPILGTPYTPKNGPTLSPFVVLDERS
jgi:HK97 family phage major capsid protein